MNLCTNMWKTHSICPSYAVALWLYQQHLSYCENLVPSPYAMRHTLFLRMYVVRNSYVVVQITNLINIIAMSLINANNYGVYFSSFKLGNYIVEYVCVWTWLCSQVCSVSLFLRFFFGSRNGFARAQANNVWQFFSLSLHFSFILSSSRRFASNECWQ